MMRTEILPLNCRLAPEFIAHPAGQAFTANESMLRAISRDEFAPGSEATEKQLADAAPPVSPLVMFALSRLESGRVAERVVVDRVNILTRHRFPALADDAIAIWEAVDIVVNEVGVDLAERDAFAVRLEPGVFDTNAEALVAFNSPTRNTGEAFSASRDWIVVSSRDRSAFESLVMPETARHRIVEDLDGGDVVVAPRAPVRSGKDNYVGWWRIDPSTGDTLGVDSLGWPAPTPQTPPGEPVSPCTPNCDKPGVKTLTGIGGAANALAGIRGAP